MVSISDLYQTLEKSIANYTGLSAATFFTILAVAIAFYHVVSGWFAAPPPPSQRNRETESVESEPLLPPVQIGEVTEEELSAFDGADPKKPLLMAIKGQIYDVTQSRMFYGPGGPYALFAGKDASRALAKMSFEQQDLTGDISGLGPFELEALQDWEYKFMSKYVKVGTIKQNVPVTDADTTPEATEATSEITTETNIKAEEEESASEDKKAGLVSESPAETNVKIEDKELVKVKEEEGASEVDEQVEDNPDESNVKADDKELVEVKKEGASEKEKE